jgi:hypothetical protein
MHLYFCFRFVARLVEAIPPEASGKHRYVVIHVPLPSQLNLDAA